MTLRFWVTMVGVVEAVRLVKRSARQGTQLGKEGPATEDVGPEAEDVPEADACVNIEGKFIRTPGGSEVVMSQEEEGCEGNATLGFTYTVSGTTTITCPDNGDTGTISGEPGSYVITWTSGATYSQAPTYTKQVGLYCKESTYLKDTAPDACNK